MKIELLEKLFEDNQFKFFKDGTYNLNIFGVRRTNSNPGLFDDIICLAFYSESGWTTFATSATTDPGAPVLGFEKMGSVNGTAMLPSSNIIKKQYRFIKGTHKGQYPALNQATEFSLVRDNNKDGKLLTPEQILKLIEDEKTTTGYFGINIHRATSKGISKVVGNWSWGCQVINSSYDWEKFWSIIERSSEIYGNKFTYTLFDEYYVKEKLNLDIEELYRLMNSSPYDSVFEGDPNNLLDVVEEIDKNVNKLIDKMKGNI